MRNGTGILFLALAVLFAAGVSGQSRIRVMLLDGQNNHDWRATTPVSGVSACPRTSRA